MAFIIGKCQLFIPEMCIGVLTTFIQACSLNRKRKAHKITCLYPLEIPDLKPPNAFGIPIISTPPCLRNSSSKNPPCLRNSKKLSVVLYGYFLELPNINPWLILFALTCIDCPLNKQAFTGCTLDDLRINRFIFEWRSK